MIRFGHESRQDECHSKVRYLEWVSFSSLLCVRIISWMVFQFVKGRTRGQRGGGILITTGVGFSSFIPATGCTYTSLLSSVRLSFLLLDHKALSHDAQRRCMFEVLFIIHSPLLCSNDMALIRLDILSDSVLFAEWTYTEHVTQQIINRGLSDDLGDHHHGDGFCGRTSMTIVCFFTSMSNRVLNKCCAYDQGQRARYEINWFQWDLMKRFKFYG